MSALYNELEPYAVQWLRNLVAAGHITPGVVDGRSIKELTPADITTPQAHFFAGIGVWSHALREAGFPDDFNVWSGSCPCQPFSAAGRRAGVSDARHLWPDWFRLIRDGRPACVVGEQVASPDGLAWLDAVQADMEGEGYAFAAFDFCAAGVGAPHIRQRLYFAAVRLDAIDGLAHHQQGLCRVSSDGAGSGLALRDNADGRGAAERLADAAGNGRIGRRAGEARDGRDAARLEPQRLRDARGLGHADLHGARWDSGAGAGAEGGAGVRPVRDAARAPGAAGRLGDTDGNGRRQAGCDASRGAAPNGDGSSGGTGDASAHGRTRGFWSDVEWLPCRDGKWRPTQPGLLPLAHGAPSRVGRLRAYGNAIVAPQAVAFLRALKPSVAHLFGHQEAA